MDEATCPDSPKKGLVCDIAEHTVYSVSPPMVLICRRVVQQLEGGGCRKFVPVLGGEGTKIAPLEDIFDQPSGEMSSIWGNLVDRVSDYAALSPEGADLVTFPGMESSYPHPPNR